MRTVADVDTMRACDRRVLGRRAMRFDEGRKALVFGRQKIDLRTHGHASVPKLPRPRRARPIFA